ncbi:hypothetical protein Drorol1_Dr00024761 [Drosera rotundifolia]
MAAQVPVTLYVGFRGGGGDSSPSLPPRFLLQRRRRQLSFSFPPAAAAALGGAAKAATDFSLSEGCLVYWWCYDCGHVFKLCVSAVEQRAVLWYEDEGATGKARCVVGSLNRGVWLRPSIGFFASLQLECGFWGLDWWKKNHSSWGSLSAGVVCEDHHCRCLNPSNYFPTRSGKNLVARGAVEARNWLGE